MTRSKSKMSDSPSSSSSSRMELVFVPAPFTGHIISTVNLAELLLRRHPRLSLTILIIDLPFDSNATAYASSLSSSASPRIRFVTLPPSEDPAGEPPPLPGTSSSSIASTLTALIGDYRGRVREAVDELLARGFAGGGRLGGFVLDMFTMSMVDVANELGVPSYLYYTSGASVLGLALHLQALRDERDLELSEFIHPDTELAVPSFSIPVPVARVSVFDIRDGEAVAKFLSRARRFRETRGILVNTFSELESHALDSLHEGGGGSAGIPPVYPVGPVLNLAGEAARAPGDRAAEIVSWLDAQPPSSVVFLCFGSMGSFGQDQVREIAGGIERSANRFLWALRRPPAQGKIQPGEYADPGEVLPEGFLERTAERGRVTGWAPQVAVLSHPAVGGFVSHCGWNSVLESLWAGVPIATWPMYAEQQMNAFLLARELGLAAEITVDYKKDLTSQTANFLVTAEEVERGIRRVMEQDSEVRRRVRGMREESRKAVEEGGSSYTWMGRFLEDVVRNMPS